MTTNIDIFDKPGTWQKLLFRGLFDTLYTTTSTVLFSILFWGGGGVIVFNATFNYNSVISWWSVLFVDVPGENHRPAASHKTNLIT